MPGHLGAGYEDVLIFDDGVDDATIAEPTTSFDGIVINAQPFNRIART
jgi:hypothetical protein